MRSERPAPQPLALLADVLAEAAGGLRPTPLELAELLWLARHMEPSAPTPTAPEPPAPAEDVRQPEASARTPAPPPHGDHDHIAPSPPRAPLHLPSPDPARGTQAESHTTLLAPAPPMLRHPLALQRALRPLKRRTAAPDRVELDERATADRIARLGAAPDWWLPVLRPARERWLRLNLVYDSGPTMPVWRPLIRELHTALAQSGIFRTVSVYRAEPDGTVRPDIATPADGRTVTLLVSDCMGPQWRAGPAGLRWYGTLRRWVRRMPLAVVQPLPEHLWRDTALPAAPGRLSAPHPAAPSAALAFTPYDEVLATTGSVPALPVLEPGPRWLANWAALVAAPGGQELPGAAAWLSGPLPSDAADRTDVSGLSPEELVLRFRATASPEAFRLAGHLAVGRPDLPVMRLVQAALEPRPRPQHLAEVILSGMLTGISGPSGSYAFRPGVRDLLLRGVPRTARGRTTELLSRVGGLIDERAGSAPGEFVASTPGAGGARAAVDAEAFATVSAESLRQLGGGAQAAAPERMGGGRYRLTERLGPDGRVWRARDTETDRTVVVRLHRPVANRARREAFLRDAEILRGIEHEGVVTVHDFGIEDDVPYVVMEELDGIPLARLTGVSGYRIPAPLLVSVGAQVARALLACHLAGVTHGGLDMAAVVLLPDGTVKVTQFAPGRTSGPGGRAEDLRALAETVLQLAAGTTRLVPPLRAGKLDHLPRTLRRRFADALNKLLSQVLNTQMEGVEQLLDTELMRLANEAYGQRFYYLLGPLCFEWPDREVHVPEDLRPMLAMLLLGHGRKVSTDELTAGVWAAGEAPSNPLEELARQAARLATVLGFGALAPLPGGYALHTSVDYVDLIECERLMARTPRDRVHYERALALWRSGPPLADVPGPAARTARTRLTQLHLGLYRSRAELDLERGEFERAATDLEGLLNLHPGREDFLRLYLIALRRQDRVEEALERYEEYELSGGQNPELRTLGRELREEFGDVPEETTHQEPSEGPTDTDTVYGFVAAPDELPEGFTDPDTEHPTILDLQPDLPEGTPLPQDDVPESLFDQDDRDEPDTDTHDRIRYEFADGRQPGAAHEALRRLVDELLVAGELPREHYRLLNTDAGVSVLMNAYTDGSALFHATLDLLPDRMRRLGNLRLHVEFSKVALEQDGSEVYSDLPDRGRAQTALNASSAQAVIVLSDFWHDTEIADGPLTGRSRFAPLVPYSGWYHLVHRSRPADDDTAPDPHEPAVRGPFPMPYDGLVPRPPSASEVIVLALPDGGFALPESPTLRTTPPRLRAAWSYFEVDLRQRHLTLDSELSGVKAWWSVADPVAAAANPETDPRRLVTDRILDAARVDGLAPGHRAWEVPGYLISWSVADEPPPTHRSPRPGKASPEALVSNAECVLLGFDGVLAHLYPAGSEQAVLQDLARLIVEERDPEDALSGQPLPAVAKKSGPLGVLRAFADHELAQELRRRADRHDVLAVGSARPVRSADDLLRTLHTSGTRTAVVTDRAPTAATQYLSQRGLPVPGGIHGRGTDLTLLMPHPHVLVQALNQLGTPASACVLIGSTSVGLRAAHAIGLPFIGFSGYEAPRRELRAADPDVLLVAHLAPLATAARRR